VDSQPPFEDALNFPNPLKLWRNNKFWVTW